MRKIENFTLRNDRGQSILDVDLLKWRDFYPADKSNVFGPIVLYSWTIDRVEHKKINVPPVLSLHLIPNAEGFIGFEKERNPQNCLLFDAYGKERMRLSVPWLLTKPQNPKSAKAPTSFAYVSGPYENPIDGKLGIFGVEAWVEYAGQYYFELDYHTGKFLWGREIRD